MRCQTGANNEAQLFFLKDQPVLALRRADLVHHQLVHAPIVIDQPVDKLRAVAGKDQIAERPFDCVIAPAGIGTAQLVFQCLACLQTFEFNAISFRSVIIEGISQQFAIRADLRRAKAEIFLALRKLILVEDQLVRAALHWLAVMLAILRALVKFRPIDPVAILLRDRRIIFLDPALHLLENRLGQRRLRLHLRLIIGVFRLEMGEDFLIVDHRIALVAQPVIFVADRHAVRGVCMRALFGKWRLDGGVGLFGHGVFLAIGGEDRNRTDAEGNRGAKFQEQFHVDDVLSIWGGQLDSGINHVHL